MIINGRRFVPHHHELLLWSKTHFMGINKDSWAKLPADIQQMFMTLNEEACRKGHEIYQGNSENKLKEFVSKGIVTVTKPSAADIALLEKTSHDLISVKWVQKMEEKGLAGQKVLDNWVNLYKKGPCPKPF